MKKRKNTEVIVRATNYDAPLHDFTMELFQIQRAIKKHKAEIEFADKYDIDPNLPIDDLISLISRLHTVEDILRGHFDILVIAD